VEYTLEVVDALPERGVATSPFEDTLDKIIGLHNDPEQRAKLYEEDGATPKWILIGRYDHSTAAGAASNVLGQRHGKDPSVEGWDFAARRIDTGDKTGLFVRYDPTRIVPGAKERWEQSEKDRKERLAKAREEKKRKEAQDANKAPENTTNSTAPSPAPTAPVPPAPSPQPTAPRPPQG